MTPLLSRAVMQGDPLCALRPWMTRRSSFVLEIVTALGWALRFLATDEGPAAPWPLWLQGMAPPTMAPAVSTSLMMPGEKAGALPR